MYFFTNKGKKANTKRKTYIKKLTENLKKWDQEIDKLESGRDQKVAAIRANLTRRIETLRSKREKMQQKIEQLEDAGEETFEVLGKDIEVIWKDLRKGYRSLKKTIKR